MRGQRPRSDDALSHWLTDYPATDSQQLRALIRQARKDIAKPETPGEAPRHGKSYREIFQLVKQTMAQIALTALVLAGFAPHKVPDAKQARARKEAMPTLFRFVITLCILAALGYGAMLALVILVEPNVAEISERVPADRMNLPRQ